MIIYFKGVEYDIPIQKGYNIQLSIDNAFDNGYVWTAPLENNLGELDLSRRIPRGLLVKIERDSKTFYFKTGEVTANQVTIVNGKYKHTINLISLVKDLTRLPLENITITQPKGDLGTYSRSVNVLNETLEYVSSIGKNVWNIIDNTSITLANTMNTNTSKINELTVVSLEE